jgi:hypothetical protein
MAEPKLPSPGRCRRRGQPIWCMPGMKACRGSQATSASEIVRQPADSTRQIEGEGAASLRYLLQAAQDQVDAVIPLEQLQETPVLLADDRQLLRGVLFPLAEQMGQPAQAALLG